MNVSSLQKRVAKSFAFDVDGLRLIKSITSASIGEITLDQLISEIGCTKEQGELFLSMPQSVIVIHSLDRFYSTQKVVRSLYSDESNELRGQFFSLYEEMVAIYKETVELIGLNASIEQVLELSTSSIFKRRDWPKIRFIFKEEIENIYRAHQERKKEMLNKSEDEIQLEWNEHIKHSKGRKLSIADKVRIKNVMKKHSIDVSDLDKGDVLIKIAHEALVDIVQINQIF
ncbi:hypothetical protein [Vibrio owensii]|uniref:hypothetical protein n=1 Tax=Vibrio owensii TaxID=696485 RepID=UPI0018F20D0F|nr:hypothetical protein [Vibrio owensii]